MSKTSHVWGSVAFFLIAYLCFEVIIQGLFILIADIPLEGKFQLTELEFLITAILSALIATVAVYLFVKINESVPHGRIGLLSATNRLRDFTIGTLFGAVVMVGGFSLLLGMGEISVVSIGLDYQELLFSCLGFFAIAYSNELIFRGYLMNKLMMRYSPICALLWSSIIFAVFHLGNDNMSIMGFIGLVFAGALLGALFLYSKNLWLSIGLHFGWNFFQTHLGFNVSGLDSYSIVVTRFEHANLLNGGEFGLEGSYLLSLIQFIILAFFYQRYRKKSVIVSAVDGIFNTQKKSAISNKGELA